MCGTDTPPTVRVVDEPRFNYNLPFGGFLLLRASESKNMPSLFNVAPPANLPEADRDRFSKMPVWMVTQELKYYPYWDVYSSLFPSMPWKPNNGDVVVSVTSNMSPIGEQVHRPRRFHDQPLIDVHETTEGNEIGTIRRHRYKSNPMHWKGDFCDFVTGQVQREVKNLTRQIGVRDQFFIRDQLIAQAENVYVVGHGFLDNVPVGEAITTSPKDASFWANAISKIGTEGGGILDFKTMCHIRDIATNDLNLPFWEGGEGRPKDNDILKGKFLVIGAGENYSRLTYDESVTSHRALAMDILHSRFRGVISDNIVYREERYPYRFRVDGTLPPCEIEQERPAVQYGAKNNLRVVPHPEFVNAPVTATIFLAADPIKTLKVGPPPSEFTSGKIKMADINNLNWNGQITATKNIITTYPDGTIENNVWGDQVQLLAQTTHGAMPIDPRNIIVVLHRRDRKAALSFS